MPVWVCAGINGAGAMGYGADHALAAEWGLEGLGRVREIGAAGRRGLPHAFRGFTLGELLRDLRA